MKIKTPQEVFKLMLKHWDDFKPSDDCICLRLVEMSFWKHGKISFQEEDLAKKFMCDHRELAVNKFNANVLGDWWHPSNQEIRKKFVKYLSEQP